jgi:hypothetical protein
MIGLTIGLALVFYGSPRFRAPMELMLILLAAGTLWWLTSDQDGTLRWLIGHLRRPASDTTTKQPAPVVDQPV